MRKLDASSRASSSYTELARDHVDSHYNDTRGPRSGLKQTQILHLNVQARREVAGAGWPSPPPQNSRAGYV
ncbi:unnamed protein product [Trichogramma brassicae]|uniref:Uncharacterized protein n=1 Tax=Trichogramma brassicae TaxID=86971 RepID=A0A6H5IGB9_9HYME|nr:unnamed protein product [Trichogramma brassicae]